MRYLTLISFLLKEGLLSYQRFTRSRLTEEIVDYFGLDTDTPKSTSRKSIKDGHCIFSFLFLYFASDAEPLHALREHREGRLNSGVSYRVKPRAARDPVREREAQALIKSLKGRDAVLTSPPS